MTAGRSDFAELLRRYRERAALTQEELADRAQLTAKAISALERGERKRPYPHTVRALAAALALDDDERAALTTAARPGAPPATRTAAHPAEPLATRTAGPPPPVAAPSTPLIGREREHDQVLALLRDGARLVTLTGPGGVGKTSLVLDVSRTLSGDVAVTVVELAPVSEARLVIPAVARALGVRQLAEPLAAAIAAHLGTRRHLVVLDNVEHVLDAAPEVAELLARCPGLAVIATSRAPLRVRAERDVLLGPLPVPAGPGAGAVAESAAAQVFLDRARAAGTEVDLGRESAAVAAICRRLDGLPLALELAAAHARYLSPTALLARLDQAVSDPRSRDLPERQRTIRATLDWSAALLTEQERALLRRLSVFAGGFTLEAAERVPGGEVLVPLGGLVEQSLVLAEHGRYRMLEPIRQYAASRLTEAGEGPAIADAAAEFFADLAAQSAAGLEGSDQRVWLDRLQTEHGNLSATLARFLTTHRHGDAALLARNTWLYWAMRGFAVEGLGWAERIPEGDLADVERAACHVAVAGLRYAKGDIAGIVPAASAAVAAARAAGADDLLAEALVLGGAAAIFRGDPTSAAAQLAEARALPRPGGDRWTHAHAASTHGQLLLRTGDLEAAAGLIAEAEATARALGGPFIIATALNAQASLARLRGDDDAALDRLLESVSLAVGVGTTWNLAYALPELGALAGHRGQDELAAQLFGAGAEAATVTAAVPPDQEHASHWLNAARDRLGERAFRRAWDAGRALRGVDVLRLAQRVGRARA